MSPSEKIVGAGIAFALIAGLLMSGAGLSAVHTDDEMGFIEECAEDGGEVVFDKTGSEDALYCEVDGERGYYDGEVETTVESGTVSLDALPE